MVAQQIFIIIRPVLRSLKNKLILNPLNSKNISDVQDPPRWFGGVGWLTNSIKFYENHSLRRFKYRTFLGFL